MARMISYLLLLLFIQLNNCERLYYRAQDDSHFSCTDRILITADNHMTSTHNANYEIKKSIYSLNSLIKLSQNEEAACFSFEDDSDKIKFAIKLTGVEEVCIDKKFMYAVPVAPEIECHTSSSTNWFNKYHELCKKGNYEDIVKTHFKTMEAGNKKIIEYSCHNNYGAIVDSALSWVATLNLKYQDHYNVYKCLDHQRMYKLSIYHLKETSQGPYYVHKDIIIKENQDFVYAFDQRTILKFEDLVIASKPFINFGNTCYVTNKYGKALGLLTKCNDDSSLVPGMFGEIKCDLHEDEIDINTCEVAKLMTNVKFDSYGITECNLNNINYNTVMESIKMPFIANDNTEIFGSDEGDVIYIKRKSPSLTFNLKSNIHISEVIYDNNCHVLAQDLDFKNIIYNKTVSFEIKVSNNRPVLITFLCNNNLINIPPVSYQKSKNIYDIIKVKFYPVATDIDTQCSVLCASEQKSIFKLKGHFKSIDDKHLNLSTNDTNYIEGKDDSENIFSIIYNNISDFFATIWGKIVSGLTGLFIILLIVFVILSCLGRIPCCLCCSLCKKMKSYKKAKNDEGEEVELNSIRIIRNKFEKEQEYYAYNGEPIKIINEEYQIKPSGVHFRNKLIVKSIPRIIFHDNTYTYKDNKVFLEEQVIIDDIIGKQQLNPTYRLDEGLVYHFDNCRKPIMMLRNKNQSNMTILDKDYINFDDSLYYKGHAIIKNIFLDLD